MFPGSSYYHRSEVQNQRLIIELGQDLKDFCSIVSVKDENFAVQRETGARPKSWFVGSRTVDWTQIS